MLINETQIISNLRRTAEKGLISLLNPYQLEELALKYFGIYEGDELVGYMCPYSGKEYNDFNEIVLEHIIPVASNGGTVLFNCIPTSKEVNGKDEKGAKHLIEWWINSKYWNDNAPERLEGIVNYMLDAYNQVFESYTEKEIEESFLEVLENDNYSLYEEDDLTENPRESYKEELLQASNNKIYSYLSFLNDCIEKLNELGIDTTIIRENLKELEQKDIFREIDRFTQIQNITKQVIKETLGDDNKTYLTYCLNIDIKRLLDSINYTTQEDIYNEISSRLKNIESMLKENNKSIIDFYQSLKEIEDINIFYKNINEISIEEKTIFIENLKLSTDTKINIFIEMLNKGNSKILKAGNKEILEGYFDIKLTQFWYNNKSKIERVLFGVLKEDDTYDIARQTIFDYYGVTNIDEYNERKKKIKERISVEEQMLIFIDMLNKGNTKILKQGNAETLDGYSDVKLFHFWNRYKDRIENFLFVEHNGNNTYDIARRAIFDYYSVNNLEEYYEKKQHKQERISVEEQILTFINMLNKGNTKILKQKNTETLEGFPNIKLSYFWQDNKSKIENLLFDELKEDDNYNVARQTIFDYYGVSNIEEYDERKKTIDEINKISLEEKILIFIEMLNEGNTKILKQKNTETLKDYPNIKLSQFWGNHKSKIEKILFDELKGDETYNIARQTIFDYYGVNNIDEYNERNKKNSIEEQILIFIEMLNKGNNKILKDGNTETLKDYPNIKLSQFWQRNKPEIENLLFDELKEDDNYNVARQTIFDYYGVNNIAEYNERKKKIKERISVEEQILIFINMLNKGNSRILIRRNKETLEGFPEIKLSDFWSSYKDRIENFLFVEHNDNNTYAIARQTIFDYYSVNNIEEYYEKKQHKQERISVEKQILIFINMLNKGNSKILKKGNKEILEGFPDIKLSYFWQDKKSKIENLLFDELKDNPMYDVARLIIFNYYEVTNIDEYNERKKKMQERINVEEQIPIFVEMLNKGNTEILKTLNKETLDGYPNINLSQFWKRNKPKIVKLLFVELKDDNTYNTARQVILDKLKVSTIEEYYEKEEKKKALKEAKKAKKEAELLRDSLELEESNNKKRA